jgi:hypothetical protein
LSNVVKKFGALDSGGDWVLASMLLVTMELGALQQ